LSIGNMSVGRNLQRPAQIMSETQSPPADNLIVTVTSLAPDRLLVSRSAIAPGAASTTVAFPTSGSASQTFYLQALAGDGEALLRLSAEGYAESTVSVGLTSAIFSLNDTSPVQLTAGSGERQMTVTLGIAAEFGGFSLRPGAPVV